MPEGDSSFFKSVRYATARQFIHFKSNIFASTIGSSGKTRVPAFRCVAVPSA
jgi:hypothetical protein